MPRKLSSSRVVAHRVCLLLAAAGCAGREGREMPTASTESGSGGERSNMPASGRAAASGNASPGSGPGSPSAGKASAGSLASNAGRAATGRAGAASPATAGNAPVAGSSASNGVWRAFDAQSPWNTPLPANPELESDSKTRIADFESSSPYGEHLDVNIDRYSIPLFYADASTPKQLVQCNIGGLGFSGGSDGKNRSAMIPWPMGALPDPETDHHLLVIDRSTGTEWGMWNVVQSGGKWSCGLGASMDLNGSGVRPPADGNPTWYTSHGARACGFPLVAGLITREEIEAGSIEHALVLGYPHVQAGLYQSPASTGQAHLGSDVIKTRGIPCGGRIQYDPSIDLDKLKLSKSGRAIMVALQKYGMYVGDHSGAISLYADGSPSTQRYFASGKLDMFELKDKIDLADFRVIKLGKLFDNGNGG